MFEIISGLPDGVIGVSAVGTIEQEDYSQTCSRRAFRTPISRQP